MRNKSKNWLTLKTKLNKTGLFQVSKPSWYQAPKRERRKDINTIAPKYYQMAENQSAEMTIVPKKQLLYPYKEQFIMLNVELHVFSLLVFSALFDPVAKYFGAIV